jgi:hypothetical protein
MATYKLYDILSGQINNILEIDDTASYIAPDGYALEQITGSVDWTGSYIENNISSYAGGFVGLFYGDLYGSSSYALTASYALNGGGTFSGSVDLTNVDSITFDTTPTATPTEGTFVWNDGDGTLDLGMKGGNVVLQLGQEQLARVYNAEATTLNDGEIVYISGSQGNRISVKRADNSTEDGSRNTIGMVTETILSGEEGFVTTGGVVHGLDTTGLTAGATLFLSSSGQYTQTRPTAPNHTVIVGFVERVHASQGSIFVKIDNGYELDELHNILISTESNGDVLVYDGTIWRNTKTLTGDYQINGTLNVNGSITGSLYGSASYSTTSSYVQNIKSGVATTSAYTQIVGGEYVYTITFGSNYQTQNYSVSINGTTDARIWTVDNKTFSGFRIRSNSNIEPTGDVFWIAIPYNS